MKKIFLILTLLSFTQVFAAEEQLCPVEVVYFSGKDKEADWNNVLHSGFSYKTYVEGHHHANGFFEGFYVRKTALWGLPVSFLLDCAYFNRKTSNLSLDPRDMQDPFEVGHGSSNEYYRDVRQLSEYQRDECRKKLLEGRLARKYNALHDFVFCYKDKKPIPETPEMKGVIGFLGYKKWDEIFYQQVINEIITEEIEGLQKDKDVNPERCIFFSNDTFPALSFQYRLNKETLLHDKKGNKIRKSRMKWNCK